MSYSPLCFKTVNHELPRDFHPCLLSELGSYLVFVSQLGLQLLQ